MFYVICFIVYLVAVPLAYLEFKRSDSSTWVNPVILLTLVIVLLIPILNALIMLYVAYKVAKPKQIEW